MSCANTYINHTVTDEQGKTVYIRYNFSANDGKLFIRSSSDDEWVEADDGSYGVWNLCKQTIQMSIS